MKAHSIGFHFIFIGLFLLWAWGAADSAHVLRHREGKSLLRLMVSTVMLIGCIILMLDMLAMTFFFGIW